MYSDKESIPVSVIIPVSRDRRIFKCIESIDVNVEIIVVLNGDYDRYIEQELKKLNNIKFYYLEEFNFSKIYNVGIAGAKYENIFFMDSDCVFKKGALLELYRNLKNYSIVKGRVLFSYNNFIQKIIAKAREFTTSDIPNLFIPGAIFKKEVFRAVGLFNENIKFASDAEMSNRITKAKISWLFVPTANIVHAPLTIKKDLKSALRYGIGRSQKHRILNTHKSKSLFQEFRCYFFSGARSKGILVAFYLVLWWLSFITGFYFDKIINFVKNNE